MTSLTVVSVTMLDGMTRRLNDIINSRETQYCPVSGGRSGRGGHLVCPGQTQSTAEHRQLTPKWGSLGFPCLKYCMHFFAIILLL